MRTSLNGGWIKTTEYISESETVDDVHAVDGPLSWKVHPLRQEKVGRSLLLIAIVGTVSWSAAFSFGHVGYGLLSLCVLVLSLAHYFSPLITGLMNGISRDHLGRKSQRAWTDFRRVDARSMVYFSAFARPSRLDSFRVYFCPFTERAIKTLRPTISILEQIKGHWRHAFTIRTPPMER